MNRTALRLSSLIGCIALCLMIAATSAFALPPDATDCGDDLGCLATAASDCTPALGKSSLTVNFFGMITSATDALDIESPEPGYCLYHSVKEEASVRFSDEIVQAALQQGTSEEEIQAKEAAMQESVNSTIGTERSCLFKNEDLSAMFTRWQSGQYSSEDWNVAECKDGPWQ